MNHIGGALKVNGRDIALSAADCDLFAGRVDIHFATLDGDGSICNIPYSDALDFNDLVKRHVAIADCEMITYDNILFKPQFTIDNRSYSIVSLHVANRDHHRSNNLLLINLDFVATNDARDATIEVSGEITAQYTPLTRGEIIFRQQPIPVRFANHYLELLGLPVLPNGATRTQVTSLFGEPESEGGGMHPLYGYIQPWIRFAIEDFYFHCRFGPDIITEVTFGPQNGLFFLSPAWKSGST